MLLHVCRYEGSAFSFRRSLQIIQVGEIELMYILGGMPRLLFLQLMFTLLRATGGRGRYFKPAPVELQS